MKNLINIFGREIEKKNANSLFVEKGYEYETVDIKSASFDITRRYTEQIVTIPANKRGNLSKYAGKKVSIFATTISAKGPRIEFYIKAIN